MPVSVSRTGGSGYLFDVATRTIITVHDDLDGTDAQETISFSLDGIDYVIDLNEGNARKLRTALRPFVAAARIAPDTRQRARSEQSHNATVRAWARDHGLKVSGRGTISTRVLDLYKAAH